MADGGKRLKQTTLSFITVPRNTASSETRMFVSAMIRCVSMETRSNVFCVDHHFFFILLIYDYSAAQAS